MATEGGSFVLTEQALPHGLVQSGSPELVLCDADFISLYPQYYKAPHPESPHSQGSQPEGDSQPKEAHSGSHSDSIQAQPQAASEQEEVKGKILTPPYLRCLDDQFLALLQCRPGVWSAVLTKPEQLVLVNMTALQLDETAFRENAWLPLEDLHWQRLEQVPKLEVEHGNLCVFPNFSFPAAPPTDWITDWIDCCFDDTVDSPLELVSLLYELS
eukprot:Protomagalhaensia_wolfi_Nauph_80__2486@NODE_2652_length_1026_cov_424_157042_g655_i1_p1_GENE_NODE_2652_length_1026_cov_424_157042_g655_i1NODE_2652_length_1026_cov_424_157042_g655_i1_p1_ORF_typecomplete_len235_score43_35_NODE_2652_length_1026_cov_424_157042_g655_i164705